MPTLFVLDRDDSGSQFAIKTMNLDGSDVKIIYQGVGVADGISFDPTTKTLFWSNMGEPSNFQTQAFETQDGSINALKYTNGKWVNQVICEGSIYTPKQVYAHQGHVYFCDREGLGVCRVSAGGKLDTLLLTGDPQTHMSDLPRQNVGCCAKDNYVYFTQKGPPKGGVGKILRIAAEASTTPSQREDVEVLIDQLPEPIDLAFGPQTGKLYWTDRGAPPRGNSLNCGGLQGNKIVDHRVIATGFKEAVGLVLSSDESKTYVTDLSGTAYEVDNSTGSYEQIYEGILCTGIELVENEFYE